MHDEYVNKGKVVMMAAWGTVIVLMVTAWALILTVPEGWLIGGMLAATACTVAALAASLQIKCYAIRTACLIRATSGLVPEGSGPRALRDL